jgi:hypothetical protein
MIDDNLLPNKTDRAELEKRMKSLTGIELIMLQNLILERIKTNKSIITKSRWSEILYKVGGQ